MTATITPDLLSGPHRPISLGGFARTVMEFVAGLSQPTSPATTQVFETPPAWTGPAALHNTTPAAQDLLACTNTPAARLRRIRERTNLTWIELASYMDVSKRTVLYWMNGGNISDAHRHRLETISDTLGENTAADRATAAQYLRDRFAPTRRLPLTSHRPVDLLNSVQDDGVSHGTFLGFLPIEH